MSLAIHSRDFFTPHIARTAGRITARHHFPLALILPFECERDRVCSSLHAPQPGGSRPDVYRSAAPFHEALNSVEAR